MSEEQKDPKIIVDEDWKSQVEAEKEELRRRLQELRELIRQQKQGGQKMRQRLAPSISAAPGIDSPPSHMKPAFPAKRWQTLKAFRP